MRKILPGATAGNNILANPPNGSAYNIIIGLNGNDNITGNGQDETIYGGNGVGKNGKLDDSASKDDDTIHGNGGNDIIYGQNGSDRLYGDAGDDTLYGGDRNDLLSGGLGADLLDGGAGNDALDGGEGVDIMVGGTGNDGYVVDDSNDRIVEAAGKDSGIDSVASTASYTLPTNVENLLLLGSAVSGTGNASGNIITGNNADNLIDGKGGVDWVYGGAGNDVFMVDNARDLVFELPGEGIDLVRSQVSYTLDNGNLLGNVENLELMGTAANGIGNRLANEITGNLANNLLDGGAGNDILRGGGGKDTLVGGSGDDQFHIGSIDDIVTELANGGEDTIFTSADYQSRANIEYVIAEGSANVAFFTGADSGIFQGNEGKNTFDGSSGQKTFIGLGGDDTYFIRSNTVVAVTEAARQGTDKVFSAISYWLPENVENLELLGSENLNSHGNNQSNIMTGNDGNNYMNGLDGDDILYGGMGNDILDGSIGRDTLSGNAGDTLIGGINNDLFRLLPGTSAGSLEITDFNRAESDQIDLSQLAPGTRYRLNPPSADAPYGIQISAENGITQMTIDTTGDGRSDLTIKLPGATPNFTAADFVGTDLFVNTPPSDKQLAYMTDEDNALPFNLNLQTLDPDTSAGDVVTLKTVDNIDPYSRPEAIDAAGVYHTRLLHGDLAVSLASGDSTFTPDDNFNGKQGFKYTVADSSGAPATVEVTFNVNAVNDAPVALPQNFRAQSFKLEGIIPIQSMDVDVATNDLSTTTADHVHFTSINNEPVTTMHGERVFDIAGMDVFFDMDTGAFHSNFDLPRFSTIEIPYSIADVAGATSSNHFTIPYF